MNSARITIMYFLIVALDSISFALLAPILAPLLASNSVFFASITSSVWHYMTYGFLIALFPLAYAISAPLLGSWSDKIGRKPVILCCLGLTLLAFLSYIGAFHFKNIFILTLGRILAGIGGASECIVQAAVIDNSPAKSKPNQISLIAVAMTIGLAIGPFIASFWTIQDSSFIFIFIIALTILNILLLFLNVTNSLPSESSKKIEQLNAWQFIKSHRQIKKIFGIFLLFELGWSLYYQSVPLLLSSHWEVASREVGFICAYIGAALTILLAIGTRMGLQ